jgi:Predicted transmembrane transcriptional regulator (anti-sigma factor)
MKNFEERYTAWMDDALDRDERAAFERALPDPAAAAREREEWLRLRGLMRQALEPARMPHADFVNSRIREAIAREARPAARSAPRLFPLPRLAFAGGFLVVLACVLSAIILSGPAPEAPTVSEIVAAQVRDERNRAYAFEAPGRAAVLWIDDAGFIPANERL